MNKKTNDYENFEKGMIYMKILKKGGGAGSREKGGGGNEIHAPCVCGCWNIKTVLRNGTLGYGIFRNGTLGYGIFRNGTLGYGIFRKGTLGYGNMTL